MINIPTSLEAFITTANGSDIESDRSIRMYKSSGVLGSDTTLTVIISGSSDEGRIIGDYL